MSKFATFAFLLAAGLGVSSNPSMAQSSGSAEEVIRQVVSALAANDPATLNNLSIDQAEFKKYVWPGIAAQISGSNTSADKYFPTYQKTSQIGVADGNTALGGKKWETVKVSLERAQRRGKGFQVFGPPLVTLRDEGGQETTVKLVGGLLERDGAYKVTTYYVSPAMRASK